MTSKIHYRKLFNSIPLRKAFVLILSRLLPTVGFENILCAICDFTFRAKSLTSI